MSMLSGNGNTIFNGVGSSMQDIITLKSLPKIQELNDMKYDTQIANEGSVRETAKVGLATAKSIGSLQIKMVEDMNDPKTIEFEKTNKKIKTLISTMTALKGAGLAYDSVQDQINALVATLV